MTTCASSHGINCETIKMENDVKLRSKINSTLNQVSGLEYSGESK